MFDGGTDFDTTPETVHQKKRKKKGEEVSHWGANRTSSLNIY